MLLNSYSDTIVITAH